MGKLTSETFLTSGSWTCPAGVTSVIVKMFGGGAGGGKGGAATGAGKHAGAAQERVFYLDVIPNTTYTVTIGVAAKGAPNGAYGYSDNGKAALFGSKSADGATSAYHASSEYQFGFVGGTLSAPLTSPWGIRYSGGDYGGTGGKGGFNGPYGVGGSGGKGSNSASAGYNGSSAGANTGAGGGEGGINAGAGANGEGGDGGTGKCIVIWVE